MQFDYSSIKGYDVMYALSDWEKKTIAEALKPVITKLEKKIERIRNHPKNEGQATFSAQIRDIELEIETLENIIKTFS